MGGIYTYQKTVFCHLRLAAGSHQSVVETTATAKVSWRLTLFCDGDALCEGTSSITPLGIWKEEREN